MSSKILITTSVSIKPESRTMNGVNGVNGVNGLWVVCECILMMRR